MKPAVIAYFRLILYCCEQKNSVHQLVPSLLEMLLQVSSFNFIHLVMSVPQLPFKHTIMDEFMIISAVTLHFDVVGSFSCFT